jgi:hypothetical protein
MEPMKRGNHRYNNPTIPSQNHKKKQDHDKRSDIKNITKAVEAVRAFPRKSESSSESSSYSSSESSFEDLTSTSSSDTEPFVVTTQADFASTQSIKELARRIAADEIPLHKLNLSEKKMLKLAPHLTYLHLTDEKRGIKAIVSSDRINEFVGKLLKKAKNLTFLRINLREFDGSAFARFKNVKQLQVLQVINAIYYNLPLPMGMEALENLYLFGLDEYNQPLPEGLDSLKHLEFAELKIYDQRIPRKLKGLESLKVRWCAAYNQKMPKIIRTLDTLVLQKLASFNQTFPLNPKMSVVEIKKCFSLNKNEILNSFMPVYRKDNQEGEELASFMGEKRFVKAFLKRYFVLWKENHDIDLNTYHEVLARTIEEKKIPIVRINLTMQELKDLAPYLTYLELVDERIVNSTVIHHSGIDNTILFSKTFIADLFSRAKQLRTLILSVNYFEGSAFAHMHVSQLHTLIFKNCNTLNSLPLRMTVIKNLVIYACNKYNSPFPSDLGPLESLTVESCRLYNQPLPRNLSQLKNLRLYDLPDYSCPFPQQLDSVEELYVSHCPHLEVDYPESMKALQRAERIHRPQRFLRTLLGIYRIDRKRALDLASALGMDEIDFFTRFFCEKNHVYEIAVRQRITEITPKVLSELMQRKDIPLVDQPESQNSPLHRLFIYEIYSKINLDDVNFERISLLLKRFLSGFFEPRTDCGIQKIDELMIYREEINLLAMINWLSVTNKYSMLSLECQAQFFPYLLHVSDNRDAMLINLVNLSNTGNFADFAKNIPPTSAEARSLSVEMVFTGKGEADRVTYLKLLAANIAREELPISKLKLDFVQLKEVAPYLTYLTLNGVFFDLYDNNAIDGVIEEGLSIATNLRTLKIFDSNYLEGDGLTRLNNLCQLRTLEIWNCEKLCHALPTGMTIENIVINCTSYDKPIPEDLHCLKNITLAVHPEYNHPFPRFMVSLEKLTVKKGVVSLRHLINAVMPLYRIDREKAESILSRYLSNKEEGINSQDLRLVQLILERYSTVWTNDQEPARSLLWEILSECIANIEYPAYRLRMIPEEILELAPYLTYLYICDPEYLDGRRGLSEEFIAQILEKGEKLEKIVISVMLLNGSWLSHLKHVKRLISLEFRNCQNLNHSIPQGMTALKHLVFSNCPKMDQPFPTDMDSLEMLILSQCPAWKKKHKIEFVLQVDDVSSSKAGKFAEGLQVEIPLQTYRRMFLNLDEATLTNSIELFLALKVKLPKKGLDLIAWAFQQPWGRAFIIRKQSDIYENVQLRELVFEKYPPHLYCNLNFFNKIETQGIFLHFKLIPNVAVDYPDSIIRALRGHFLGSSNIQRFTVEIYGSSGRDAGGLSRQFAAQFIMGLLNPQKSQLFAFTPTEDGKVIPQASSEPSRFLLENYQVLGYFLGLAYRNNIPTGAVFSEKWLHCIHSFTDEDLDNPISNFIDRMDNQTLVGFMEDCTAQNAKLLAGCKTVLLEKDETTVKEIATQFNELWRDDLLQQHIDSGNIEEVRKQVRNIWVADFEGYLLISQTMVKGMRRALSFYEQGQHATIWENHRFMTAQEFSVRLQGQLTADWIKENHKCLPAGDEKSIEVKQWMDKWLDEHRDDPQSLGNFVQTLSGGRALSKPVEFRISNYVESIYAHTCFFYAEIPRNIDETIFRIVMDDWGNGKEFAFTRS